MKKRLIILGTGFAAVQVVRNISLKHYEVTVVSPRNYFLFTPLLASTSVGTLEFRSIIEPIRTARKFVRYVQAECLRIDAEAKTIECRAAEGEEAFELFYDMLIVAVGVTNNTFGVSGVEEHALFLKELPDARAIRQELLSSIERASAPDLSEVERKRLLHFVVVGGGPTGVEFAGELHDFLQQDLSKWFPDTAPHMRVTLIEAGNRLLNSFSEALSTYTMRNFSKRNIEVYRNTPVTAVTAEHVELADGRTIPYGILVWSGGIAATSLVAESQFPKNDEQRIYTDGCLEVINHPNVFAAGDCAIIRGEETACTAQVAQQQGRYLAKLLNRIATEKSLRPFFYLHMGMLAYVGGNRALADTPGPKLRGFVAWLMWRSVYLTKLVSFRNKVLVLFDWCKTKCFGRDISRF